MDPHSRDSNTFRSFCCPVVDNQQKYLFRAAVHFKIYGNDIYSVFFFINVENNFFLDISSIIFFKDFLIVVN